MLSFSGWQDFLLFVEFAERQSQAAILKEIQGRKVDIAETVTKRKLHYCPFSKKHYIYLEVLVMMVLNVDCSA